MIKINSKMPPAFLLFTLPIMLGAVLITRAKKKVGKRSGCRIAEIT